MPNIHPTALIHPTAEIGEDASIGAYTTVEQDVRIGPGSKIGAYVTLGERLVLGRRVQVYNYACLGTPSQDKKHHGQRSHAEIGDGTTIREFATVNRATREGGVTRIGKDVLVMTYAHVAHECEIGDGAVLVNGATIGGEVVIEPDAIISGLACVHQFCRVGRLAIVGANSKVTLDIPPYVVADGHPARPYGPNGVGLRRHGFSEDEILEIRRIYRDLFDLKLKFQENLGAVDAKFRSSLLAKTIVSFCQVTSRGIARPRPRSSDASAEQEWELEFGVAAAEG